MPQKGYKQTEEHKKKSRKGLEGKRSNSKGHHWKLSEETKSKMSIASKGKNKSAKAIENMKKYKKTIQHKRNISKNHHDVSGKNNPMHNKKHSTETKLKISIANGIKKGWITPITKSIRKCFKYRQWRSDIFTRDNYTCQLCDKYGGYLQVDHYPKTFSEILRDNNLKTLEESQSCEELWNINNGRTLCVDCHKNTDTYGVNIRN